MGPDNDQTPERQWGTLPGLWLLVQDSPGYVMGLMWYLPAPCAPAILNTSIPTWECLNITTTQSKQTGRSHQLLNSMEQLNCSLGSVGWAGQMSQARGYLQMNVWWDLDTQKYPGPPKNLWHRSSKSAWLLAVAPRGKAGCTKCLVPLEMTFKKLKCIP